jgi:hypothetical protein
MGRVGIALLLFALLALAALSGRASAEEQGAAIFTEHGEHQFTVPAGIYWLTTEVQGAHGGTGDHTAEGGNGGLVTTTIYVNPGDVLRIFVGEYGGGHGGEGWAHGGDHGTADGALNNCHTASGGGGSSAVVLGSTALVGAGGGGGGGGDCGHSWGGRGGASGKLARDGENSPDYETNIGTGGCGGCRSEKDGGDGHNAHYDESGGGGGGAGGGTTNGGEGGRDGSVGAGTTGTGGGGGGAGDSAVNASRALNTRIDTGTSEHDGSVILTWGTVPSVTKPQSGGNQKRQILGGFDELVAKVTDSNGIPAVGVTVQFTAPASGPSGTFGGALTATAKTNRDGIVVAPPLRANAVSGEWTAIARVPGYASSAKFALENIAAQTTTTITSDANPSVTGQPVIFRADVRSAVPDAPAGGTVQFTVDGAPYGDPVALTDGSVSAPAISDLAPGSHTIGAEYRGDTGHSTSDASLDQTVDAAATATTVTPTLNPAGVGDTVAFVAAVAVRAPASGVPTGSVQFARDGTPFGAPVTLDATGHAASPDQTFSSEGQSTITATYTPDGAAYGPSSGGVVE